MAWVGGPKAGRQKKLCGANVYILIKVPLLISSCSAESSAKLSFEGFKNYHRHGTSHWYDNARFIKDVALPSHK